MGYLIFFIILFVIYLWSKNNQAKELYNKQEQLRKENHDNLNAKGVVKCPKCLSTQTSANKRGITVTTGLIGSQQVYITCLQCGHRWKAGS